MLLLDGRTERAVYFRADHAPVEIRHVQGRLVWPANMDYLQPVDALPSGQTIYRNNNYAGRIYLAQNVTGAANRDQAIRSLRSMAWENPAAGPLCVLEAPEAVTLPAEPPDGQISDIHWDLNTISFKVQLSQRGVVVLADSFDPAWRAELDGRAIDIYRANAIHKAVIVPAGTHQVTLRFSPISVYLGLAISLATAVALVWTLVFGGFWPLSIIHGRPATIAKRVS